MLVSMAMMPLLTLAKRRAGPRYPLESIYFILLLLTSIWLNGVNCQDIDEEPDLVEDTTVENLSYETTTGQIAVTERLDDASSTSVGPIYKSKLRFLDSDDGNATEKNKSAKLTHPIEVVTLPTLTFRYRLLPGSASYHHQPEEHPQELDVLPSRAAYPTYAEPDSRLFPRPSSGNSQIEAIPQENKSTGGSAALIKSDEKDDDDDKKDVALHFKYRLISQAEAAAGEETSVASDKPSAKVYAYSPLAIESRVVNSLPAKSSLVHTLPPYQSPRPFHQGPHFVRPPFISAGPPPPLPSFDIYHKDEIHAKFPSDPKTILPPPDIAYVPLTNDLFDKEGHNQDTFSAKLRPHSTRNTSHVKANQIKTTAAASTSNKAASQEAETHQSSNETASKDDSQVEMEAISTKESVRTTISVGGKPKIALGNDQATKIAEDNQTLKFQEKPKIFPQQAKVPKDGRESAIFEDDADQPKIVPDALEFSEFVRGRKFATKFDVHNDRKARKITKPVSNVPQPEDGKKEANENSQLVKPVLPKKSLDDIPEFHANSALVDPGYNYEYKVAADGQNYGHREASNGGRTEGQYKVALPDGRVQVVRYYADSTGFHPDIAYEI